MAKQKNEGSGIPHYLATFAQDNEIIRMRANGGYVIAPQKIIRCYRLNDIEKVLLLEIISYMGIHDYAFPSHKRLAFKLGKKSTASIKNALKSLKDKGFIDWGKGGGDIGTNRYTLSDLYSNPYLIMSEFTQFFVEEILDAHRGEISYEDIYSTVLQIVEKTKSIGDADDPYGICIHWLFEDINLRDAVDMYLLFGDILKYNISSRSNIAIQIDVFDLVDQFFGIYHLDFTIAKKDEHPIHKVLKNPYDEEPFEVKAAGISDAKMDVLRNYYAEVSEYVDTLDEKELYKIIIEKIVMPYPDVHLPTVKELEAFLEMEDLDGRIDLIKDIFAPRMLKIWVRGYYLDLKEYELDNT
ncbi:helix-turn-helix domain-containing protein [Sporosarcina sp. E16_8]|uniref:helix-turn-helix domain-containing protein n=1 Tax=Sporosarcina sp. E16_8 TaxID=2789295 RepID=UPI001A91A409|nr:helix-turn-helix domain-containing protein [Sporosarcina sp. E16_8]MBO0587445.1 helix-turn-helix domain-containing protein [Sporosarcina sp. E16_8]